MKQLNFIIGIQGTIVEHSWRCNLTTLGIGKGRQDKIIRRCMTASIEGMQRVLRAVESGGGERKEEGSSNIARPPAATLASGDSPEFIQ